MRAVMKFVWIPFALVFLAVSSEAARAEDLLRVGGTGGALGTMRILAEAFGRENPDLRVEVPPSLGSGGGIRALLDGGIDIGLSARALKESEKEAGARSIAYARTPFLLAVAGGRGATDLSRADLSAVFGRKKARWPDGRRLHVVLRPEDDSHTTLLIETYPELGPLLDALRGVRGVRTAATDQEALDLAERLPGVLATGLLSSLITENRRLDPVSLDGVAPSVENLENGSYPMAMTLRLVVPGKGTSSGVGRFIDFLRSETGSRILIENGHLPVDGR